MSPMKVYHHLHCHICDHSQFEVLLNLPQLPLTGRYTRKPIYPKPRGMDQKVLWCTACGHVQLAVQIDPKFLYDDTYYFRTSTSLKAKAGTDFFLNSLKQITGARKFHSALDVGCNDLYLLNCLKPHARHRTGIDPIWITKKSNHPDIEVIGSTIEGVDLPKVLGHQPDLIVCRHTLEHIARPVEVLKQLMAAASNEAVFCFEVPGFDGLYERYRFDQIFHEHLNYYSLAIFRRMIEQVGGEYLGHFENRHDWGALFVAFRKGRKTHPSKIKSPYAFKAIQKRYELFKQYMSQCSQVMANWPREQYGFGAAQMLPVLAYHLKTDFSQLKAVLDDDPAKAGLQYWNFPLKILSASQVDLRQMHVVLTAVDNVQPILLKLLKERPKDLLVPLMVF